MSPRMYITDDRQTYYDFDQYRLYIGGKPVETTLTPTASMVLEWLAVNSPNSVSVESILQYTKREECYNQVVKNDIRAIRVYMNANGIPDFITTRRGIGYSCSYKMTDAEQSVPESDVQNEKPDVLLSPAAYCRSHGILGFLDTKLDNITDYLENQSEIYIVSTTGGNLIKELAAEFMPRKLSEGVHFTILLANKYSEYDADVASIEGIHPKALASEFQNVIVRLRQAQKNAIDNFGGSPDTNGRIHVGCSFSLLRQTITMGVSRKDNTAWGWLSMTTPPSQAISGTPSFAFSGKIDDEGKTYNSANYFYTHIKSLIAEAKKRNAYVQITPEIDPEHFNFGLEKESAKEYWKELHDRIKSDMAFYAANFADELIEVAAQHPLIRGGPAPEFRGRLDFAYELYTKLKSKNPERAVHIYIPGSIHKPDTCSLSEAGKRYLLGKGVPEEDLFADEKNIAYKGERGVYNSADECYVAAQIFQEGAYRCIHCVCSPNQMMKKQLFYLQFGVIPLFHTVPFESPAHDFIYELFNAVPDIIYNDHTWQAEDSFHANRTRKGRQPGFEAPEL